MAILKKDDILNAQDLPFKDVEVPQWGGTVRIRALNSAERDAFEQSITQFRGNDVDFKMSNIRAKLVALTAVDENGNKLFTLADAEKLGKKSAVVMDKLFQAAQELSGMRQQDLDDAIKN
jgi:hypothetical protein